MKDIRVRVPATSANCGPGFDCLGLALNHYNYFTYKHTGASELSYVFKGYGADILAKEDPKHSYIGRSMAAVFAAVGETMVGGEILVENEIPPSRGLGSSSTAIVAGLLIANKLVTKPLSMEDLLLLANELEGHPDNVAPALLGELICAKEVDGRLHYTKTEIPKGLRFAVVVPSCLVSTEYARSVLPKEIAYRDAVDNVGYVSLFVSAMSTGKVDLLRVALTDKLHVPYRKELIPHCEAVFAAAREAGAYGTTISGSGSTLIAYCDEAVVETVAVAMKDAFTKAGMESESYVLDGDKDGACYVV